MAKLGLTPERSAALAGSDGQPNGGNPYVTYQDVRIPKKYATLIGDGVATVYPVAHGLATSDVIVQVWNASTGAVQSATVVITDANTVTITISPAPAASAVRVVILG